MLKTDVDNCATPQNSASKLTFQTKLSFHTETVTNLDAEIGPDQKISYPLSETSVLFATCWECVQIGSSYRHYMLQSNSQDRFRSLSTAISIYKFYKRQRP